MEHGRKIKKNQIAPKAFPRTDQSKKTVFYGKMCIKACLEVEKTQVVCCSHPQNSYFLLNSINVPLWYVNIKIPWILLYKRFLPIVLRDSAKIMARLRNWYCSFYTVTIFVKTRQFPAFCSTITVLKTNWICFVFFKFLWVLRGGTQKCRFNGFICKRMFHFNK